MATQGVRTPASGKQEKVEAPPKDGKKTEGKTKKKTTKKAKSKTIAFPIETGDLMQETLAMEDHERKTIFGRVLDFIRNMFRPPAPPGDQPLLR